MSRQPRAGGRYIIPIDSNGATLVEDGGHGVCTLAAGQTYYYVLGGIDASFISAHLTGIDPGLIITSATVQDCNHADNDVSNFSTTVGDWSPEKPSTAYVSTDGTGWTASNGQVAVAGGSVGCAFWHLAEDAAARTRIAVVVGATGGKVRMSGHGKD